MSCNINLEIKNKVSKNYISNESLLENKMDDIIEFILNDSNKEIFDQENIYKYVSNYVLYNLKNNNFFIFNVNLNFELLDFMIYIHNNFESSKTDLIKNNNKTTRLVVHGTNIIVLFENFTEFKDIYKNKKLLNKLKKKFKKYTIKFILFSYEKGYSLMNTISRKYKFMKNLMFIDCLRDLIHYVLPYEKDPIYKELIKVLNFKKSNTYTLSSSFNYIYDICVNIKKLKFNTYKNPNIKKCLELKLFNQNEVVDSVVSYTNRLKTQLKSNNRPIGSWLLCGPSGTGKTELAKILAYSLFGSKNNLLKIDMSEYMEPHSVSRLIGSPPGYEGHGEENILSKNFKNNSSFVILFDEIEKAHKDINNLMLQILDEGRVTLSDGDIINFNKSFIIFTSNLGYSHDTEVETVDKKDILKEINKFFRIEFLNRLSSIIIFNPIDNKSYMYVLNKFIKESSIKFDFYVGMNYIFKCDLIEYSYNVLYGSRPIKRLNDFIFNKVYLDSVALKNKKQYNLNYLTNFNKCLVNISGTPSAIVN